MSAPRTPRSVTIIGCGLIGVKRAGALPAHMRLTSVFDVDPDRASALAGSSRDVTAARSPIEAIERGGHDSLVIVATTHDSLAEIAQLAVERGCNVLIEKPGARKRAELEAVAAGAARNGVAVRVGFNHRFHPAMLRARELIEGQRYGEVLLVRARYGHGGRIGYENEWRADAQRAGGGELLDQGVHLIDLTAFFSGAPTLRYGAVSTLFWKMPVEDNAFVHLGLAGGGDGWIHASWTEWKNLFSFEITCRTAKIEISGLGGSYGPERLTLYEMKPEMGPPDTTTFESPPGDDSWAAELADLDQLLDGQPALGTTLEECMHTLALIDEVYKR
ncbi:MAG: Gfo/Idh/MocA family oxidoreductase [Acidimicrobiales bacterium]